MSPSRLFKLFIVTLGLGASPTPAQTLTGPFQPFNSWWIHPAQGTLGVSRDTTQIRIDRDGNGITESLYDIPQIPPGSPLPSSANLRLSPTREFLVAYGPTCGSGTSVYIFTVAAPPNLTLLDTACIANGVSQIGFYDTGLCTQGVIGSECAGMLGVSPQRVVYVSDVGNAFTDRVLVTWFDLSSGTHVTSSPGFNRSLQLTRIAVSPGGDAAMVEHNTDPPAGADFTLIDLCPARLGQPLSSAVGGALFNLPSPQATAQMVAVGGGFAVRVTHPSLGGGSDDFAFTSCGGGAPVETSACCVASAGCTIETAADCSSAGGTWLGPNTSCSECVFTGACCFSTACQANVIETTCVLFGGEYLGDGSNCDDCDILDLDLSLAGPSQAQHGSEITYTLTFDNVGDVAAANVSLVDPLPSGTVFVSATGGGMYTSAGHRVTWSIDPLAIGASGSRSVTVRTPCNQNSITNAGATISAAGGTFFAFGNVVTQLFPSTAGPVRVTVQSPPPRVPLHRGDIVPHTITIENATTEPRVAVNFNVNAGNESEMLNVTDAGGGTATILGAGLNWTGNLPANSTRTISFATRVLHCANPERDVHLNFGNVVVVRSACGSTLGEATPPGPFDIFRPTTSTLRALAPIPQPQADQQNVGIARQLARPGATVDVQLMIANASNDPQATITSSFVLPAGVLPVGDPPFVAPTASGATWNAMTRTVSWSGDVAPGTDVQITVRCELPTSGACVLDFLVDAATGTCNDLDARLMLHLVPQPPTEPHLLGVLGAGSAAELWTHRPGIDTGSTTQFCMQSESLNCLAVRGDGEVWVGDTPLFRMNPHNLTIAMLPNDFVETTLGIVPFGRLVDILVDPVDDSLIFVGYNQGVGLSFAFARRYVPATGVVTDVFDGSLSSPQIRSPRRAEFDANGHIVMIASAAQGQLGIVRVDPATQLSPTPIVIPFAGLTFLSTFTIDADGDYIVTPFASGSATQPLVEFSVANGTATELFPNLNMLPHGATTFGGCAVGPDDGIYLSRSDSFGGASFIVRRGTPATLEVWPVRDAADLWVVRSAPCIGDLDGSGDVGLSDLAILLANFGNGGASPDVGDLNGDAQVNLTDLATLLARFGLTCP
ncbi:MAG: hypothetical protein ACKVS9_16235 [Phycisphaerae bacterium]